MPPRWKDDMEGISSLALLEVLLGFLQSSQSSEQDTSFYHWGGKGFGGHAGEVVLHCQPYWMRGHTCTRIHTDAQQNIPSWIENHLTSILLFVIASCGSSRIKPTESRAAGNRAIVCDVFLQSFTSVLIEDQALIYWQTILQPSYTPLLYSPILSF